MRDSDYRDRYQRKLSRMRAKYRRRILIAFIMALVLGFLLGWILFGMLADESARDKSAAVTLPPSALATATPGPTWFDEAEETGESTEEPTAEPTAVQTEEPTAEPTSDMGMTGFMDGSTVEPTVEPTAEPTVEPTAMPTSEVTAEPTTEVAAEATAEPAGSRKGSIDDPILIGEPVSFTAQVNVDGTMREAASEEPAFDLPVTVTLSRYLLPDYYAETYQTKFQLKGDEAGAQLDIMLGAAEGLSTVSMQDAIKVVFEDANGQIVQGYKFTNAEIGGDSTSALNVGAGGTIFKRYSHGADVDLKYLVLTYFYDAQPVTIYFSLTESVLPAETPEPEATPEPTQAATGEGYTVGSEGEGVKQLQQKLIDLGYLYGKPDGKFGNYTADAVKAAQKAMGLEETGIADAAFLDALSQR